MTSAVRITAVPRSEAPNSGLQALHFAAHYGDEVWALPAPGAYIGDYDRVSFFFLDRATLAKFIPLRVIRLAYLWWLLVQTPFRAGRLFFVHSFIFAIPLYLLRQRYCIFVHGTDRRFLDRGWARRVARGADAVFGVGFGVQSPDLNVQEVPNVFTPAPPVRQLPFDHDVLFVLRNAPVKNPLYPISLAERLGARLNLRIAVIGVGPEELPPAERERLDRLLANGQQVRYLGRQPYEEVARMMGVSRILVVPSFSEGIPKALLEGMSQGMHVVINQTLEFSPDIMARVESVDIDDWTRVARIIEDHREGDRSEANIAFAREYLTRSQDCLLTLYDDVYARHRGVDITGTA